jgi:hypothetical protein
MCRDRGIQRQITHNLKFAADPLAPQWANSYVLVLSIRSSQQTEIAAVVLCASDTVWEICAKQAVSAGYKWIYVTREPIYTLCYVFKKCFQDSQMANMQKHI